MARQNCRRCLCYCRVRVDPSIADASSTQSFKSPVRGDLPTKTRYPLCCCASNREPLSRSMLIPRKAFGALTLALCIAGLFIFSNTIVQWSVYLFGSHAPLVPYTTHVVLFQFKETATSFAVKEVRSRTRARPENQTELHTDHVQVFRSEEVVCPP